MEKFIKHLKTYNGKILDLYVDEVELDNGMTVTREKVDNIGGATILAINENNNILFVKQFRYGQNEEMIELPAGKLSAGEQPIDCAKRELEEETGYIPTDIEYMLTFAPTPAYVSEKIHIFIAKNLTKGTACLDEDEFLNVLEMPIETALTCIKNGTIKDGKTIIALEHYALYYLKR